MKLRAVHPIWPMVSWALIVPMLMLVVCIFLVVATDIGSLPFDNGQLWWLGAGVPLASGCWMYGYLRKRRALERFVSAELAPLLAQRVSPSRQAIRAGLMVTGVLMVVAAIIGPRWGLYLEKQKINGVDVVVALDVSRSMLAQDVKPDRLTQAKIQIRQQLTERPVFRHANRLGLIAFAGSTSLRVPLTSDHLAFRTQLDNLGYGSAPGGGTAIGKAIDHATDLFANSPASATKIVLLFTDGEDHEGGPVEAAKQAYESQGIRVFTIGVGDANSSAGVQVPSGGSAQNKPLLHDGQIVFSKLDVASLKKIGQAGGGQYAPLDQLHAVVSNIAGMWQAELSTEQRERHRPRYQWFIAIALLLLGMNTIIGHGGRSQDQSITRVWQQELAT